MSRIGKMPIQINEGVTVSIEKGGRYDGTRISVKGPKGELHEEFRKGISFDLKDNIVELKQVKEIRKNNELHGLYRTMVQNMIEGVVNGFSKQLQLIGVGYKVALKGTDLELKLGLNHTVIVPNEEGITFEVSEETIIKVSGPDKVKVGQVAARIRRLKKKDPYKGKGIYYIGERIRRKAGKAAKADA